MDRRNRVGAWRRYIGVGKRYVRANRRYVGVGRRCIGANRRYVGVGRRDIRAKRRCIRASRRCVGVGMDVTGGISVELYTKRRQNVNDWSRDGGVASEVCNYNWT